MIDYSSFHVENLEFWENLSWIHRLRFRWAVVVFKMLGFPPPLPIIIKRKRLTDRFRAVWWRFIELRALTRAIGLDQPETDKILATHDRRLLLWTITYFGVVLLLVGLTGSFLIEAEGWWAIDLKWSNLYLNYIAPSFGSLHPYSVQGYQLGEALSLRRLERREAVPDDVLNKLGSITSQVFIGKNAYLDGLRATLGDKQAALYETIILQYTTRVEGRLRITDLALEHLQSDGVPDDILSKLHHIKDWEFNSKREFLSQLKTVLGDRDSATYETVILRYAFERARLFQWVWIMFFIIGLPGYVLVAIILRVAPVIVNKYFAESLCIHIVLGVILDLSRDNVLTHPMKRKVLLARIGYLRKTTQLLASRYVSNSISTQKWSYTHFLKMAAYLQEQEHRVIAPTETSLDELRQDFYRLASIYISGTYGDAIWQDVIIEEPEPSTLNWRQRMVKGFPRFVGIILPLVLMGLYLWQPGLFPFIVVDPTIITFVFLAWLLLSIDASLNLGIVSSVVSVAKGIKELK